MPLLQRIQQVSPAARRAAAAPPGDLFERYFSAGFAGLTHELDRPEADPAAQAGERERLSVAQADLKRALSQLEADTRPARETGSLPAFIMQTFLQSGLKEDADLLAFARQTAADPGWSDAVRGQALLLIAKLGGKEDLAVLYPYLESPSTLLQARAMQAIAELHSKLSASDAKG